MAGRIHTAPPGTGTAVLGKTLPGLLFEAAERQSNPRLMNQPHGEEWRSWSLQAFKEATEELAVGLLASGLERGDRVALFLESDVYFCMIDLGCLLSGMIDVPIYLTHGAEQVGYVVNHSEARAVAVASPAHLRELKEVLAEAPNVRLVILAEGDAAEAEAVPAGMRLLTLDAVRARGRDRLTAEPQAPRALLERLDPQDLATIIYTSGTTGRPKGVMLSHENISSNALTSFSGLGTFEEGADEVSISFLPLTHIFARTLQYGYLYYATTTYFSTPDNLSRDLKRVRPTTFATVPRVLEKVYGRILERVTEMTGLKKRLLNWALGLAGRYDMSRPPTGLFAMQLRLADVLVFKKWREALGGRVRRIICGGAALNGELNNLFDAAGVVILQGYGLTETSPVITYNRPGRNRAGTVGEPIPGVEVRIADDGEIITRGPHVMLGYYKDEERTAESLDAEGWFHTGDIGEFTPEGFLRITDRKKDLFKLSTGKYVMPQPLENRLTAHPLIEQVVVVGAGYKFTTALIFPEQDTLRVFARSRHLDGDRDIAELLREPLVVRRFQELVDKANAGMDPWSTIKRFSLVPEHLTVENGMLTPTMKVRRSVVQKRFDAEIGELYTDASATQGSASPVIEM